MPEGLTFAGSEGLGGFEVEQARRDDEVAGGGDGQKFGDALDHTQNDGIDDVQLGDGGGGGDGSEGGRF